MSSSYVVVRYMPVIARIFGRPTYANVISSLALLIALGGSSYAALNLPRNSVKTRNIAPNAVNGSKVKNGSLRAADFAAGELPPGDRGPQGDRGIPGERGLQGLAGANGAVGPASPAGKDGKDGVTGGTGPTGPQGLQARPARRGLQARPCCISGVRSI